MNDTKQDPQVSTPAPAVLMMMVFWMLLGAAAGIKLAQSTIVWRGMY